MLNADKHSVNWLLKNNYNSLWFSFLPLPVQVVDGCTVLNPGHLTRKASGGTYAKFVVSPQADKINTASDIGTQILHI